MLNCTIGGLTKSQNVKRRKRKKKREEKDNSENLFKVRVLIY